MIKGSKLCSNKCWKQSGFNLIKSKSKRQMKYSLFPISPMRLITIIPSNSLDLISNIILTTSHILFRSLKGYKSLPEDTRTDFESSESVVIEPEVENVRTSNFTYTQTKISEFFLFYFSVIGIGTSVIASETNLYSNFNNENKNIIIILFDITNISTIFMGN
jgi:hypothetical protein